MLKLLKLQDPQLRWAVLSQFQPQSECYVVSDIKTKKAVEGFLLNKHGSLPGSPVLRMKEFLREIFYHLESPWQLTPESFLREIFAEFAQTHKETLIQNSSRSKDFFIYFYRFFPLLLHSEGQRLMEEWIDFKRKEGKGTFWVRWWHLSQEFFKVLQKKHIISEEGLKGLLIHYLQSVKESSLPFKKVIFDLGVPPDRSEQELLKELSKKKPVELIAPHFEKEAPYYTLGGKNYLEESDFQKIELINKKPLSSSEFPKENKQKESKNLKKRTNSFPNGNNTEEQGISPEMSFLSQGFHGETFASRFFQRRFHSSLSEVKGAIAQIHKWLNQGLSEEQIVLLAPDIENYWFCLKPHLERENISFQKSHSAALIDFPETLFWLSRLRLHLGFFTFPYLETGHFYKKPTRSFSDFHSLFSKVPERKLSHGLLKREKIRNKKDKVTGKEFIKWASSFWPQTGSPELLELALESLKNFPLREQLKWAAWLRVLEQGLFSLNKELVEESPQGLSCLSLNAVHSIRSSYVFILGLNQDALSLSNNGMGEEDMEALSYDLGFPLSFAHPRQREWNLLWFLQSTSLKEVVFSFSDLDFSGLSQTPSLLWTLSPEIFSAKKDLEKESEQLKVAPKALYTISSSPEEGRQEKHTLEKGVFKKTREHFSGTALKKYAECPFAYAVEYIFNFRHFEGMDRELSPLDAGKLMHSLLEKLFIGKDFLSWKEKEIDSLIESLKPKKIKFIHDSQWTVVKKTLKKTALQILEEEVKIFKTFPDLKVLGQEQEVTCYWNLELKDFAPEGDILFKGRIDRLDYEPSTQSYFIRDYKNSVDQINHINRWTDKKEMQLLLYALILEKGLIKGLPKGKARVLDYYSYRDLNHKGYVEKGSPFEGIFGTRWQGQRDRKVLEDAFQWLKTEVHNILNSIEKGEFAPEPSNKQICERCSWRTWCRAPHLN